MATKTDDNTKTDDWATFTVANGRTIDGDDGTFGPGETVTLSVDEGARLQKLGFLVGDDGTVAVDTGGPAVVQGVEIKES